MHEGKETAWFQTRSEDSVASPPAAVTGHRDLQDGDIYMHKMPNSLQLWLWELPVDGTSGCWKSITRCHQRMDGHCLHLTQKLHKPSWTSSEWALCKLREEEKRGKAVLM